MDTIKSLLIRKTESTFGVAVEKVDMGDLPTDGELLVRIQYSCINYKDALAITNQGNIIRGEYPFVPGIDLAGIVMESSDMRYQAGDSVVGTGGGLGEIHWGGLSSIQRISSEWIVTVPERLSAFDAMVIGTAGVTAMLSVVALEEAGIRPENGEILVTGATGGVGSLSIRLLANAGYTVVACTGKTDVHDYLTGLGAARVLDRSEFSGTRLRPMDKVKWAGAVDTVGSQTLARIISQIGRHGAIAVCGLAGGSDLHLSVFPFILRGIKLLGIDSNTCPVPVRQRVWARLAEELSSDFLRSITTEIGLDEVVGLADSFVKGKIKGRYVVRV